MTQWQNWNEKQKDGDENACESKESNILLYAMYLAFNSHLLNQYLVILNYFSYFYFWGFGEETISEGETLDYIFHVY